MVHTAALYDDGPIAFRYPRGNGTGVEIPAQPPVLEIGKGRIVREGVDCAILSYGTRLEECLKAADILAETGISATVADARFAKPLDESLIRQLAKSHGVLVTVEEGSVGGFGSFTLEFLAREGLLDGSFRVRTLHLPDSFIDHDSPAKQYDAAGLNAEQIARTIASLR
jgi:1-deoxy-D-xylulose-5-phosphate synthase